MVSRTIAFMEKIIPFRAPAVVPPSEPKSRDV